MKTLRSTAVLLAGTAVLLMLGAGSALAQSSIHPTNTPEVHNGGWVWDFLFRPIALIAAVLLVVLVIAYLRFAPRFAKDEESARFVHADRVLPGKEAPRRAVDLSQAVPIVVQPARRHHRRIQRGRRKRHAERHRPHRRRGHAGVRRVAVDPAPGRCRDAPGVEHAGFSPLG